LSKAKERVYEVERSLGDAQPTLAAYERVVKASGGKGVEELVRMLEHVNHLTVRQHQVHTGHKEGGVRGPLSCSLI
jgi:hypothetical protein